MSFTTKRTDKGADRLRKLSNTKDKQHVAIGVLGDSKNNRAGQEMTNAGLAAIHEFGTEHIPERSFLRSTIRENLPKYKEQTKLLYSRVLHGIGNVRMSAEQALGILGLMIVADVKAKITAGIAPANKAETIKRKGSSTPLIDTGALLNSIQHQVRNGEKGKE